MPAAIKKDRRVECHVCHQDVRVTSADNVVRHRNRRKFVCKGSATPKQNRIKVVR